MKSLLVSMVAALAFAAVSSATPNKASADLYIEPPAGYTTYIGNCYQGQVKHVCVVMYKPGGLCFLRDAKKTDSTGLFQDKIRIVGTESRDVVRILGASETICDEYSLHALRVGTQGSLSFDLKGGDDFVDIITRARDLPLRVTASLGSGNDFFALNGTGNYVNVTMSGGTGNDKFLIQTTGTTSLDSASMGTGADNVSISDDAGLVEFYTDLDCGSGVDITGNFAGGTQNGSSTVNCETFW